ncbi:MAG: hypothetical protein ACOCU4_09950, partial [Alkalispirochaeta sp.]
MVFLFPLALFAGGSGESAQSDAMEAEEKILRVGLRKLTTIDPALGANDPEVMFHRLQYASLLDILA